MAARKIQIGERRFELTIKRGTDPKVASQRIADFHRSRLIEAREHNRSIYGDTPRKEITSVDGRVGAPLESVKPDGGRIITLFPFPILEVIEYIDYLLVSRSPIGSSNKGAPGLPYQRSHRLFADGTETDPTAPNLNAKEWVFVNTRPFARKIEGSEDRKPQGSAPPEGVYRGAVALANQKFGNFVFIRFTFQAIVEAGQKARRDLRYPAIRIRLR